jgi:hypothetical protein
MNGDLAHPPPGQNVGWPRQRLIFFIALALAAHVALIFIFGTRKETAPCPVVNAPLLQFADSSSESIALDDPTLFALPHANDFGSPIWLKKPVITPPLFSWTEPPRFLPLAGKNLGAVFNQFMQTNPLPQLVLNFKPEPQFSMPDSPGVPSLPQSSTLQIVGELAKRPLLNHLALPSQPYDNVIQPSQVQVLVDAAGDVLSVVLLPDTDGDIITASSDSGSDDAADQQAMDLARTLRFAPAPQVTLGKIIFNWHTVPLITTNTP